MSLPAWSHAYPWAALTDAALRHGLDPNLVAAIIAGESSGQRFATRYEKGFRWLSKPQEHALNLGLSLDTEVIAQSHSYGLMQIMGGTARGLGFDGYCVELVGVDEGLEWGCKYLATCLARFTPLEHAIAAFNAGSPRDVAPHDGVIDNMPYVQGVLKRLAELDAAAKVTLSS